jgi:hypothetical protein
MEELRLDPAFAVLEPKTTASKSFTAALTLKRQTA